MLDILHNGVTKKVNGSLKETEGLLIISGALKWQSNIVDNETVYTATFIDPRIKPRHTIQSIKSTVKSLQSIVTTDLTTDSIYVGDGLVSITVSDVTIVRKNPIITITMYDVDAVTTPSGMPMEISDAEVTFTNWKVTEVDEGDFTGTVAVKIEDSGLSAPSLATVVDDSFTLQSRGPEAFVNIRGVKEILPDGRLTCNVQLSLNPNVEVFPASATDASINYVYIASDNVRMIAPEADAEWVEQEDSGVIFYEATFAAEVPDNVHLSDVAIVYGENGEKFPKIGTLTGEDPKMYSYVTSTVGGAKNIVVHWTRDTMPETAKLTAEVYVANYEALEP